MKSSKSATEIFIRWCALQQWNFLLFLPWAAGMAVAEINRKFAQLMDEVEKADGTLSFRWARMIPKDPKAVKFYVLVGGLGCGSWWFWTRRWAAIMADRELRAGLIYGFPREKRRLAPVMQGLLAGKRFDFEMRVGPKEITRSRKMDLDEFGGPVGGEALLVPDTQKGRRVRTSEQLTLSFPAPRGSGKATTLLVQASKNTNRKGIR